jgi:hypothetical protein
MLSAQAAKGAAQLQSETTYTVAADPYLPIQHPGADATPTPRLVRPQAGPLFPWARKSDECAPTNAASIAKIWTATNHRSAKFQGCPAEEMREVPRNRGSVQMTRLVIDLVLFSCTFAFVTGIVIAAANLLI